MLISTYGVFFAVAVYSIFRKGFRLRSSIAMFCVIVSLYASSPTVWAITTTLWFKNAHSVFMDHPNMPLPDRRALANANIARLDSPVEALYMFNMVVGDAVVIWRAWVLYPRKLWVLSIPCILLLISFIFGVIQVTCVIASFGRQVAALPDGGRVCSHANVSWSFSLATNTSCTVLIGYKAQRVNFDKTTFFAEDVSTQGNTGSR